MIKFNRMFNLHEIQLIIFDLDGTLIDSRLDLIQSVNAMLRHFGRPNLSGEVVASYVGDGAPMLVRRALGDPSDDAFFKEGLKYFLNYYREHKLDHTTIYAGINNALTRLQRANRSTRRMAVLSNKPVRPAQAIVKELGLGPFFAHVYGGDSFPTKKPDPLGVRAVMDQMGSSRKQSIIVGDSSIDVVTGRNAGIYTCGVMYGFAPESLSVAPPDVVIDHTEELAELFGV